MISPKFFPCRKAKAGRATRRYSLVAVRVELTVHTVSHVLRRRRIILRLRNKAAGRAGGAAGAAMEGELECWARLTRGAAKTRHAAECVLGAGDAQASKDP